MIMNNLFKELSESEELDFRAWARDNYKPYEPIKGIWHPIVQQECVNINRDYQKKFGPVG